MIALRSAREVSAYVPKQFIAISWDAQNPASRPGILLAANNDDRDHVVNHELTHVISFGIIKNQPPWLSEGIATYFEMADLESGTTSVQIGIPRDDRAYLLRQQPPLSAAQLFACKEARCLDDRFYATSWALFSFLLNTRYDQLARYLQRLNELPASESPSGEHARAWRAAFPELTPDRLDDELLGWLHAGKIRLPTIDVTVYDVPARERPLADADVLAARSLLSFQFKNEVTGTRMLSEALRIDRTNLLARLIDTEVTHSIPPGDARATAAAPPGRLARLAAARPRPEGRPRGLPGDGPGVRTRRERGTRMRSPAPVTARRGRNRGQGQRNRSGDTALPSGQRRCVSNPEPADPVGCRPRCILL